jgi:hypothetical protein
MRYARTALLSAVATCGPLNEKFGAAFDDGVDPC